MKTDRGTEPKISTTFVWPRGQGLLYAAVASRWVRAYEPGGADLLPKAETLRTVLLLVSFAGVAGLVLSAAAVAGDDVLDRPYVFVNEVMASNATVLADGQGQFDDWVELYNPGREPVDLAGMYLTDDPAEPTRWVFPAGGAATIIGPRDHLIVWTDGDTLDAGLHANFRLNADGDEIYLFAADGETLIDGFSFGPQTPDISFGRTPDGGETLRFFAEPTPGDRNSEGYLGEVAPLVFSHERGFYGSSFNLTIATPTEGAQITYTLDGRIPDDPDYRFRPGQTYTGPIPIDRTTCVRAIAVKPGWKPTALATHTYILDAGEEARSLPVISLVGDAAKTFYEPMGVMAIVGGTYSNGVWTSTGADSYNNVLERGLERPVSAEWIDPEGGNGFHIDCGLRVHGSNYMRPRYVRQNGYWSGNGKFSFRLYFRGEYGRNRLEYPLFPESDVEQFASIVLRGGHNDRVNPFIKDELLRRLHKDMGQRACMGTFANLFINGEYKGYFNVTEHVKEESCQEWFDSDQPWDVMTMNGIRDGNAESWNAMINYARGHDLSVAPYYRELAERLDVVAFVDYLILQLWAANWDWPTNNWSAAGERSDEGLWRFFVWDAEGTMESRDLNRSGFTDMPSYAGGAKGLNNLNTPIAYLYRALRASADFRLLFADRIYKHFYNGGAMTEQRIVQRFSELREAMRGVIPNMNTYVINTWVPNRRDIFIDDCAAQDVYTFDGPMFAVNGAVQYGGYASANDSLHIVSPVNGATIYYTLDGTDPGRTAAASQVGAVTLVSQDMPKRVLVPTDVRSGRTRAGDWRGVPPYDDSTWILSTGAPGGIGYEQNAGYEGHISTDVGEQMYGVVGSCYIRIPFVFSGDEDALDSMALRVQYDDGFVAFLNGEEIARRNFEGEPAWDSVASVTHGDTEAVFFERVDVSNHIRLLHAGDNVLAIHGLNASLTSSDFLINAELEAAGTTWEETEPNAPQYDGPITLTTSTHVKARAYVGGLWSALSEATFAVGPVAESLRISEIMYHPAAPNTEYVELTNVGAESLDLNMVRFTDGIDFTFPSIELAPGDFCLLVGNVDAFEAEYGPGLPIAGVYAGSLNNAGERIELRDAAGQIIHRFEFRDGWYDVTDGLGFSLTVRDVAGANPSAWGDRNAWRPSVVVGGSPGFDDSGDVPTPGAVVINELLANAAGNVPDWIELHNTTDEPVHVGGWFLSDDADEPTKYEIVRGTTIGPGGYLVLTEDRQFGNSGAAGCHTPFALSRNGETVYLNSGSNGTLTGYTEQQEFGPSDPGVPFGRHQLSTGAFDFAPMGEPTPGGPNAYPAVGPVVITEIMYHPDGSSDAEYVELRNISDLEVTLYDFVRDAPWRLADDPDDPGLAFLLPSDEPVTLAPGQYLLLVKDKLLSDVRYSVPESVPVFEWGAGKLSNAGETVHLGRPGDLDAEGLRHWIAVDSVTFSDGAHGEDFADGIDPWPVEADGFGSSLTRTAPDRYGNDPNNWQADIPSPGVTKRLPGR